MDLLALVVGGGAMLVVVIGVGVLIEVLVNKRLGTTTIRHDPKAEAHQQAVRSQLGGFGPQNGGPRG